MFGIMFIYSFCTLLLDQVEARWCDAGADAEGLTGVTQIVAHTLGWNGKATTVAFTTCTCVRITIIVRLMGSLIPRQTLLAFLVVGGEGAKELCHDIRLLALLQEVKHGPASLRNQSSSLH
jgi:hypothetical protein